MRTITRIALYAMPLLIAAACDTTEESYYLGPESDITISVEQKGAILLSADGTAQTIDVKATTYWDATIEESGNTFSVKQSVEKGDGTVTVEGQPNYNSGVKQGKLYLSARNINKRIEVDVMQAQLKFSMGNRMTSPFRRGVGRSCLSLRVPSHGISRFHVVMRHGSPAIRVYPERVSGTG